MKLQEPVQRPRRAHNDREIQTDVRERQTEQEREKDDTNTVATA